MIFTSDRFRRRRLAAALMGLAAGLLAVAGPAGADADPAAVLLREARAALGRGDGIAAEVALRKAQQAGVPRRAIAARMGEALLDQGELRKARAWLGGGDFAPAEAAHGWRMLGRLDMAEGDLIAAGKAFDRVLQLTPRDSRLWVDISRLRYQGGEQLQAIAAADQAVRLDPRNPRALEWRGLLVRDSFGLPAALPWFEAGLAARPDDLSLLGEYAATLGELGRARDMLVVTRKMIGIDPRNPRAFLLQAMLAARAGDVPLARRLLARAGPRALDVPAGLLLSGTLELEAGNAHLAVELLDRLLRLQPENAAARLLLARAMGAANSADELIARFGTEAGQPGASSYLATLVARAHETRGRRDQAGLLLDAAARPETLPLIMAPTGLIATSPAMADLLRVRQLVAAQDRAGAEAAVQRILAAVPGSAVARLMAGDLRFLAGDYPHALEHYRAVAAVRLSDPLVLRIAACLLRSGQGAAASQFIAQVRAGWPREPLALRLQSGLAAERGQWAEAAALLGHLDRIGLSADPRLQGDRAWSLLQAGDGAGALAAGRAAFALQPLSPVAAKAYGLALQRRADLQGVAAGLMARSRSLP